MYNPKLWLALAIFNLFLGFINVYVFNDIPTAGLNGVTTIVCVIAMLYMAWRKDDDDDY